MQTILSANHHRDTDISKEAQGRLTAPLCLWPPAKLLVCNFSLGCWINAAMSIITSQKAKETWWGWLGRANKDRFQVSTC